MLLNIYSSSSFRKGVGLFFRDYGKGRLLKPKESLSFNEYKHIVQVLDAEAELP